MSTPMQEQYNALKKQYHDAILLFRLGDFYEGFDEDARILSKVLGIALTGRGKDENRKAMAGIPYHALNQYLPKLLKAGYKVAIGEQMEAAEPGKLVARSITRVITPGTILDERFLTANENNYLACLFLLKHRQNFSWGLAFCDISTGEFKVLEVVGNNETEIPREILIELFRLKPAEIIIPRSVLSDFKKIREKNLQIKEDIDFNLQEAERVLLQGFKVKSLKGFGIETLPAAIIAAGVMYTYLKDMQKTGLENLTSISQLFTRDYMLLDQYTIRNLELIDPIQTNSPSKTFFDAINYCATAMGQRLLKQWILRPLVCLETIIARQEPVSELFTNPEILKQIRSNLQEIPDLERIIAKIAGRSSNARDLQFLKTGLVQVLAVFEIIASSELEKLKNNLVAVETVTALQEKVINLIEAAIVTDPPLTITEGEIIKPEYNSELAEIKTAETTGKDFIHNLEQSEIARTGINSLKVRYNRVFGYYIEISKSNLAKVPENYIRKQTLVNAERFITEDLKIWEEKVLGAAEKAAALEYQLFETIRQQIVDFIPQIIPILEKIKTIDVLAGFAKAAIENHYCCPELSNDQESETLIIKGRHPVVEQLVAGDFIANDVRFQKSEQEVIILTGPNMSGKSTYIRQIALIFLMAQIGSFVPASSAQILIADRIFTRVGASDNLAGGESTFLVEMNETANILNNATARSLIIFDEVGRGTSTYDGVAIAWSIVEYLITKLHARTLFATHYHELIQLSDRYSGVQNYNVQVLEDQGQVMFMHKIEAGGTDKSYGIHVAEIAGLPKQVTARANEILKSLENEQEINIKASAVKNTQMTLPIVGENLLQKELQNLEIDLITPLDALVKLKELQDKSKQ
ncbi:MAG: DNA mismatch repair protein MutS [bacterium]